MVRGVAVLVLVACAATGFAQSVLRVADAAEQRDTAAVSALIKRGADVNAPQPDGATALHWAAHWNEVGMMKALLGAGARPDVANDYGVTPLFLAATNGSVDGVAALLDKGANANAALPSGETVLMTASRAGSAAVVRRLLASGANPNASQISKGQNALMWAAAARKVDVVKALIEGGADVNAPSKGGFTPLLFAAREGAIDIARLLLAAGADIEASGRDFSTPLLVATVRGQTEMAHFLLDQGAKADGNPKASQTPLHYAVSRSEHPFAPKDTDLDGEWAAMAGIPDRAAKLKLIDALLAHGADIEARKSGGGFFGGRGAGPTTPFVVAATSGDAPMMRLLMQKGAKPIVKMQDGTSLVMSIISAGNAFKSERITEAERIDAIKLALELGADIEAQDANGYRAMHLAAGAEFQKIILFLLSQGADLNPVTKTRTQKEGTAGVVTIAGQSPLGIVEGTFTGGTYNERPETAAFLRKLGAKSIGRATLDSYVKQQLDRQQGKTDPSSAQERPPRRPAQGDQQQDPPRQ